MKLYNFFISMICFISSLTAMSQSLSLEEIKANIIANNPALKMYDAEIASINAGAKGAWTWMPPEISTGFFMMPYDPSFIKETEAEEGMGQYMIGVQQMIPNRRRQEAEFRYMESMANVEAERKKALIIEIVAEAKKNYYEGMILQKKLSVLKENEELLEFMIQNAEIRYKNGLGKINAYYKAKAALGSVKNMQVMFENEFRLKLIQLNTLMNRDKNIEFELDTSFDIREISPPDTSLLQSRSDIRALEREIEVIRFQQQFERLKLKPEFGVRFDHMIGLGGQPAQYTAMGMVRLPVFSWSARMNRARIESMKLQIEARKYQQQMLVNEWSGMANQVYTEWLSKKRQIEIFENTILPALQNNYGTMLLGYEQNTEELFELFDAWEALNMTQIEYLDRLLEVLLLSVEIEEIFEWN